MRQAKFCLASCTNLANVLIPIPQDGCGCWLASLLYSLQYFEYQRYYYLCWRDILNLPCTLVILMLWNWWHGNELLLLALAGNFQLTTTCSDSLETVSFHRVILFSSTVFIDNILKVKVETSNQMPQKCFATSGAEQNLLVTHRNGIVTHLKTKLALIKITAHIVLFLN